MTDSSALAPPNPDSPGRPSGRFASRRLSAARLSAVQIDEIVARALAEDLGRGDVTSQSVVPIELLGVAHLLAREPLRLAGVPIACAVFRAVDPAIEVEVLLPDGSACTGPRQPVIRVSGPVRSLLTAERVALNFLQHCSGIASHVARLQALLPADSEVRLVDTRKTRPGMRLVEKYAVTVGGAHNHRMALDDGVMIKDNHLRAAGSVAEAVRRARLGVHHLLRVQVEASDRAQALEACAAGADSLLLDNFAAADLVELVGELRERFPRVVLEASGGIDEQTIPAVAATGVDVISSGALIHQARWVDLSMDLLE